MSKSMELYEQLKEQLALESSNTYTHLNLLKLVIEDIGDSTTFDLLYDSLPTDEIKEDDSRYSIYLELQDKNCKSLRNLVKRLEKIKTLVTEKIDINLESREIRLEKLFNLAQAGSITALTAFDSNRLYLLNASEQRITFQDLLEQIKQKEKYQKMDEIIGKLLKVYEDIVNERIKRDL